MSTTVRPSVIDIPEVDADLTPPVEKANTKRGSRVWIVALVILLVAVAGWQGITRLAPVLPSGDSAVFTVARRSFPVIESIKGELKAAKTTDIKSKVEGRATIIWLIDEGETVKEGDLLVRLASDKIEERIQQEEANEASAIAALEASEKDLEILIDENKSNVRKAELAVEMTRIDQRKYLEGDARKAQMDAELALEKANQQFERAKIDCDAAKSLREQGFITQSDLLQNEFALEEARRAIDKAKLGLKILNEYEVPKQTRQRESDVDEAVKDLERVKNSSLAKEAQKHADVEAKRAKLLNTQNQLKKYRGQLADCEMRAPAPGLVVYFTGHRYNPQEIAEGSEVYERQTIVTLPDPSLMLVTVRVHEAKTSKIKLGQQVNVEVEAIPDRVFTGKITKIAPLADSRNQWLNPDLKEYETEITLDQTDPALKPGVTARAEIIISHEKDVTCVPLQAVYSKGGYHYVFRDDGHEGEPVEVELGASNDEFVTLAGGINVGDRILLSVSDAAKTKLPDREVDEQPQVIAELPGERRPKVDHAVVNRDKPHRGQHGKRGERNRAGHGS